MTIRLRPATLDDATDIAALTSIAGEGLPEAVWKGMVHRGETPLDAGARYAARMEGKFSWKNATVAEINGETAGMMISYVTASQPEPLTEDMHPIIRPLTLLENQALETRYIYVLATYEQFRGNGIAHCMLEDAEAHPGKRGVSVITTNRNAQRLAFYEEMGYRDIAQAPVIKTNWNTPNESWHLLLKP